MGSSDSIPSEEDVLLEFSAEASHEFAILEEYLQTYPQYTDALIDLSLSLKLSPLKVPKVEVEQQKVEQAWEQFQSLLSGKHSKSFDPFAALNGAAFRGVAEKLNISVLFLVRLRDRTITASTLPKRVQQAVANALNVSSDQIGSFLSGAPNLASGASYRAPSRPAAQAQISFEEAVAKSGLTQEQQQQLLAMRD
jgi:hypothetical protein